jgi:AraC-like DNA-binding protein
MAAIAATRFDLSDGHRFDEHQHHEHQLAWASHGVVTIGVGTTAWVLPRSRALWIPAGVRHDVEVTGSTTMMGLYFDPAACPISWREPTVVETTGLLGHLLEHLTADLAGDHRRRVERVVFDLFRPVPVSHLELPVPTDDRTTRVAAALRASPHDDRSLDAWGREVGASGRTLARIIERETGMGFAQWRTRLRMAAALPLLAAGTSVSRVAPQVGYATPSAFVAAFRRTLGTSPGAYFAAAPPAPLRP